MVFDDLLFPEKINNKQLKEKKYKKCIEYLCSQSSESWDKVQDKQRILSFESAYKSVAAYKDFIDKKGIKPRTVRTLKGFKSLPIINKKDYLLQYDWKKVSRGSTFTQASTVITSTSGSTGEPFYFSRTSSLDIQTSLYYQMFLDSCGIQKNKPTLVVDCFGMGVWIGGLITYQAFKEIADRGYVMSIVTPGVSKPEIFKIFKNISKYYDQIILCGYPPFIKDIIDEAADEGIDWKGYKDKIKIIFAAEGFTESFRERIASTLMIQKPYTSITNIYGTADLGTMAYETPLSILIRKLVISNQELYKKIFGQVSHLPTLAQYIPHYITFEELDGSLYATGGSSIPLVRYALGDNGGTFSFKELLKKCEESGIDLLNLAKKEGIHTTITELPFVYVYERTDFSISFYGALIYPEFIKRALDDEVFSNSITGKFTMTSAYDKNENQYIEIIIEMRNGVSFSQNEKKALSWHICNTLQVSSSEYKRLCESLGRRAIPKLVFLKKGDEKYFSLKGKHRWLKK